MTVGRAGNRPAVQQTNPPPRTAAPQAAKTSGGGGGWLGAINDAFDTVAKAAVEFSKLPPPLGAGAYGASRGFGKDSAHGPISKAEYADTAKLVGKLTQYPYGRNNAQSEAACGAANLLGITLLNEGPGGAATMLEKVADRPYGKLTDGEKTELKGLASKLKNQTATFEDLNRAQVLLYRSANDSGTINDLVGAAKAKLGPRDQVKLTEAMAAQDDAKVNALLVKAFGRDAPQVSRGNYTVADGKRATDTSGLSNGELENLGDASISGVAMRQELDPNAKLEDIASQIEPGQAMVLRLGANANDANPDHYVTVGRKSDGTFYIYNPDPGKGDSTLVLGNKTLDDGFKAHLARYDARMVFEGENQLPPALRVRTGG